MSDALHQIASYLVSSLTVLLVSDLFHPIDSLTVEPFLDRDMGHCRCRRGAVPVLLTRRNPDHIPRPDLFDRAAFALRPAAARGHNKSLTERMRMPSRPCTRLECDAGTLHQR